MRKFFKVYILFAAVLGLSFFSGRVQAELTSPKVVVQKTLDDLVAAVQQNKGEAGLVARRAALRQIINPQFDFAKMAQLSLGANWNSITPDQQKEFVAVFSDLLAKTYLSKVESIEPGMVTVESERIEEGNIKAVVKTLVKSKGDYFPIDYRLVSDSGGWKVFDVVIENIGLVVNYRNEFASIIRKDTFAGLMEQLRKKSGARP